MQHVSLNVPNRTLYHGDNLDFMRALDSNTIDLIATDPPFNKGRDFHATPESLAAGAKFDDRWKWTSKTREDVKGGAVDEEEEEPGTLVHEEWIDEISLDWPGLWCAIESAWTAHSEGMVAFLCWLGVRVLEMHRILKPKLYALTS